MLFKLFSIHQTAKAWKNDPTEELGYLAQGAIVGYILTALLVSLGILALLIILAFTNLLGGPYTIAKVLFFLTIIPLTFSLLVLRKLLASIRGVIRKTGQSLKSKKSSDVIDVTIDETDA